MHNPLDSFSYHINWKSRGHHPGQHKSGQRGMGMEFAGHSNLLDSEDIHAIFHETIAHRLVFNPVYELKRTEISRELSNEILNKVSVT